jgi:hypothetical protein
MDSSLEAAVRSQTTRLPIVVWKETLVTGSWSHSERLPSTVTGCPDQRTSNMLLGGQSVVYPAFDERQEQPQSPDGPGAKQKTYQAADRCTRAED